MKTNKITMAVTVSPFSGGVPEDLIGSTVELSEEWKKNIQEYYQDVYLKNLIKEYKRDGLKVPKDLPELYFINAECPIGLYHR